MRPFLWFELESDGGYKKEMVSIEDENHLMSIYAGNRIFTRVVVK